MKILQPYLKLASICAIIGTAVVYALNVFTLQNASDEWVYTLEWINLSTYAILFLIAFLWIPGIYPKIFFLLCIVCISIPLNSEYYFLLPWQNQYVLSACWAASFLCGGIFLLLLAARTNKLVSWLLCGTGSIIIGLGAGEFYLLLTAQVSDGISNQSAHSRHLESTNGIPESENWLKGECGKIPGGPGKNTTVFERIQRFDAEIFDVVYTLNDRGWRKMPGANVNAENDLLIFGCSISFGYGLENNQTWAWKLARLLGPDWKVENYAANGYGPGHMLCMLEHHMLTGVNGKNRIALFLTMKPHIRRNEFFPGTPHYQLTGKGEIEAGGKGRYNWIYNLPAFFNGSQLAREGSIFLTNIIDRQDKAARDVYLATLQKSAQILRESYNTKLIALLYPDMENLGKNLENMGIETIPIRRMLPELENSDYLDTDYPILKPYELHPNEKFATQLANGLATYLKNLVRTN